VTAYQQAAASPAAGARATPTNPAVDAVPVLIKRLDQGLPLPARAHPGDAGVDLCTAVDVVLAPGERALVPTGMAIALPEGYAAFVHPRSGLAARHGVTLVNAPGTVDAGYRGEIKVTLINTDRTEPVRFERGDRIAQLVVQQVACPQFHEVQTLPGSARGDGGFGSTGGHGPGQRPGPRDEGTEPGAIGGFRGVAPLGQHDHGGDESTARQ
jgi:dUTP pyrophosphatase